MTTNGRVFISAPSATETVVLPEGSLHSSPFDREYGVFNMMIYGEVGEGKTPLVGSVVDVEEMMPALLIDCDEGTLSIRDITELDTVHLPELAVKLTEARRAPLREKNPAAAAKINVDEWGALEHVYNFLRGGEHQYKTVILDGGSDLEKFCENNILSNPNEKRADRDAELAEIGDYRRIQERLKRTYTKFRDVRTRDGRRMNLLATAHEAKGQDPQTMKPSFQPMYIGKGKVLISSRFDIVARLVTVEEGNRRVKYLVPSLEGRTRGRDRSRALGDKMQDPSMRKIYDLIFAKQEVK